MRRKHIFALFLCILTVFALTACGTSAGNTTETDSTAQKTESASDKAETEAAQQAENQQADTGAIDDMEEPSTGSKVLVVYFSRTGEQYGVGVIDKGNTAIVADMIIEATRADSFEILPQEDYYPYTYDELTDVAKKEQNENARPAYAGDVPDLSQYETIFIGAPDIIRTS